MCDLRGFAVARAVPIYSWRSTGCEVPLPLGSAACRDTLDSFRSSDAFYPHSPIRLRSDPTGLEHSAPRTEPQDRSVSNVEEVEMTTHALHSNPVKAAITGLFARNRSP